MFCLQNSNYLTTDMKLSINCKLSMVSTNTKVERVVCNKVLYIKGIPLKSFKHCYMQQFYH